MHRTQAHMLLSLDIIGEQLHTSFKLFPKPTNYMQYERGHQSVTLSSSINKLSGTICVVRKI